VDLAERIRASIRTVQDFPIRGIPFPDVTSMLEDHPDVFREVVDAFVERYRDDPPDAVVCIESFGYVFGVPLAYLLGTRLVLVRRAGKLPRDAHREDYDMIYDTGRSLEMHAEAVRPGDRALVVDDVLASGGSVLAAIRLVERSGGDCVGVACLMEASILVEMPARKELSSRAIPVFALVSI
jgi:adenine phosphoribosyltransferase